MTRYGRVQEENPNRLATLEHLSEPQTQAVTEWKLQTTRQVRQQQQHNVTTDMLWVMLDN